MLYLFWGLLNIAFSIFLVVVCFRLTRLVREKFGLFAAIVLVFMLLSFARNSNNDNKGLNKTNSWQFTSADSLENLELVHLTLEKNLLSSFQLGIQYGKDKQQHLYVPASAESHTIGFSSGTYWKPGSIIVNKTYKDRTFEYYVDGIVEWKLLGATIYSQQKMFKGFVTLK